MPIGPFARKSVDHRRLVPSSPALAHSKSQATLAAATEAEREHFAISIDKQQLIWPELDEDMDVTALLLSLPESMRH